MKMISARKTEKVAGSATHVALRDLLNNEVDVFVLAW
jgi:hypothetical protein